MAGDRFVRKFYMMFIENESVDVSQRVFPPALSQPAWPRTTESAGLTRGDLQVALQTHTHPCPNTVRLYEMIFFLSAYQSQSKTDNWNMLNVCILHYLVFSRTYSNSKGFYQDNYYSSMRSGLELDTETERKTAAGYIEKQIFTLLDIHSKMCLNFDRCHQLVELMRTCASKSGLCRSQTRSCALTSCLARAVCLDWTWALTSSITWIFFSFCKSKKMVCFAHLDPLCCFYAPSYPHSVTVRKKNCND